MTDYDVAAAVGERLQQARRARGISQKALAEALGVTQTTLSYWENGKRVITVEDLLTVAGALEVTADSLLSDTAAPTPVSAPAAQVEVEAHSLGAIGAYLAAAPAADGPGHIDDLDRMAWLVDTVYQLQDRLDTIENTLAAGKASDGYHTHNELYRFRAVLHAHAVRAWLADGVPVVKSWRHHTGEACFGGGWFIVVAELASGQVSNHYPAETWEWFAVPEVELPPVWDGHSAAEAADRMEAALGRE